MNTISKKFTLSEISILLKIAIPLILTGFVESSVAFCSTLFLAHLGKHELAAGAIVSWIFVTMMVILWGTITSVSVVISQKHGAKDSKGVSYAVRDGLILAVVLVIPTSLLLWYMAPILVLIGQNPDTVALAQDYMHALVWGVLPDFVGLVLMQFLIGLGHTRSNMVFALVWVPINVFCNYALIFGKFGMPALGMAGIGWGTSLAYWITTIGLFAFLLMNKKYAHYFRGIFQFNVPSYFRELLQIGIPMGAMYCIEIAFFMTLTLFMGKMGNAILAANQITLQFMGVLSVFTFSMAQAITVRMGHALGAGSFSVAIRSAYIGICMASLFMSLVACVYWFFPSALIAIDLNVNDPSNLEVIQLAKRFFAISALFQICEATRFGFFGALRALKDTRFTLLASIFTFWCIAFPMGYLLAFVLHFGGEGFWWGIMIGEAFGVFILFLRFRFKIKLNLRQQVVMAVMTQ